MRLRLPAIAPVMAIIGFCLFEVRPVSRLPGLPPQGSGSIVTVGPANTDIIGSDDTAIRTPLTGSRRQGAARSSSKREPTRSRTPFAW